MAERIEKNVPGKETSMAQQELKGQRVAALLTDGVEQVELTEPMKALQEAGAEVKIVALKSGKVKAWDFDHWGEEFDVDLTIDHANPNDFQALLLPGGVMNPDTLRMNEKAVQFVRQMVRSGKPVASICHGPWMLVEADVVEGRTLTSYPSLQTDIRNAGGKWVDQEVVVDQGIVTSRNPNDLPAFIRKMIEEFREGDHDRALADAVEQASEESFPASDAPSWSPASATPDTERPSPEG